MTAAYYKSGDDNDKSDNNKDKVCLLLNKIRFGESNVRSRTRLHARSDNHRSYNHGVILILISLFYPPLTIISKYYLINICFGFYF